jgi:spermidine/putrescine transport system permease protein
MKLRFSRSQLCIPYALFLALFVVLPLVIVFYFALTDKSGNFSLANFSRFFFDPALISTMIVSMAIGAAATIICLLLGYPVAYILARSGWRRKNVLLLLLVMPMWINFVLRINALKEFMQLIGILGKYNFLNTVLGMVYDFLPFMILPLYTTLIKIDKSLLEASADLGATPSTTFLSVTLPLSTPGILSGITMVFMPTMTVYVISDALGLGHVVILGKQIEHYFGSGDNWNMGSTIALVLLLVIFASTFLSNRFKDEESEEKGRALW